MIGLVYRKEEMKKRDEHIYLTESVIDLEPIPLSPVIVTLRWFQNPPISPTNVKLVTFCCREKTRQANQEQEAQKSPKPHERKSEIRNRNRARSQD